MDTFITGSGNLLILGAELVIKTIHAVIYVALASVKLHQ